MSENIRKEIEKELNGLKNNLDKFTSAVEIFDEAKKLASEAGQQISQTTKENKEILDNSSAALTELLKEQSAHIELFEETLTKLTELQQKISDSDIPSNLEHISSSLDKLKKEIKDYIKKVFDKQESQLSRLNDLNTENKKLSNTLNSISTELKNVNSSNKEIKELIEVRNKDLKSLNNEIVVKFNFLTKHVSSNFEKIEINQKKYSELQRSQYDELKKLFKNEFLALDKKTVLHQKIMYGGIILIIVYQIIMLLI